MKKSNQKEKKKDNPKFGLFHMMLRMFAANGLDEGAAYRRSFHQTFMNGGNPEYFPIKHPIMSYAE